MSFTKPGSFWLALALILITQLSCRKQSAKEFILTDSPLIALSHVRVIDGTGAPAREDQTIIIDNGVIKAIGSAANVTLPAGAKVLDLQGHTAIPGLVGMHEHLFYSTNGGTRDVAANLPFAQLYLASGVTTIRTAGTLSLENDLTTKRLIDQGEWAGPKIHLTSPYINHPPESPFELDKLSAQVNEWAEQGVTSLKIYTNVRRAELGAVIRAAHQRGLMVTAHPCAVGFREAAALGIDNLEHGLATGVKI